MKMIKRIDQCTREEQLEWAKKVYGPNAKIRCNFNSTSVFVDGQKVRGLVYWDEIEIECKK